MSVSNVKLKLFFTHIAVISILVTCAKSIDPDYSINNRVESFLNSSLNTILSVMKLDERPITEDVTFWCANRGHEDLKKTTVAEQSFKQNIDLTKPLVFIIHGWFDNHNRTWVNDMTEAFLLYQDINVCIVDWQRLAQHTYALAAANTKKVGLFLGKFIKRLNNYGLKYEYVSLVGHSFGSHIAGYAGAYVGGKINTIYGLDPAGPRFAKRRLNPISERLDPSDARFVQVIHTDKDNIGTSYDMGHQDFYPNDGSSPMPGCFAPALQTGLHYGQFLCSHYRAVEYFTASINPNNQFIGQQCKGEFENYARGLCDAHASERMGIYAKRRIAGRFYLGTTDRTPFAMGRARRRRTPWETWQKKKDKQWAKQFGFTKSSLLLNALVSW